MRDRRLRPGMCLGVMYALELQLAYARLLRATEGFTPPASNKGARVTGS